MIHGCWRSPPCMGQDARSAGGGLPGALGVDRAWDKAGEDPPGANRCRPDPNRCTGPGKVCFATDRGYARILTGSWALPHGRRDGLLLTTAYETNEFAERFWFPPPSEAGAPAPSKASRTQAVPPFCVESR